MYKKDQQAMTPLHEEWEAFADLAFQRTGRCAGTLDETRVLLAEQFPGVDTNATLRAFEARGGHCDCEVRLNIVLGDAW